MIRLVDSRIFLGFKPDKIEAPASMYSGLSVLSLIDTHGFLKYKHSSGTVPESVIIPVSYTHLTLPTNREV